MKKLNNIFIGLILFIITISACMPVVRVSLNTDYRDIKLGSDVIIENDTAHFRSKKGTLHHINLNYYDLTVKNKFKQNNKTIHY